MYLKRLELINRIFNQTNFKTYLEIGCYKGKTFFNVIAKYKIAVDPFFHPFFIFEGLKGMFKNHFNFYNNKYFKVESDIFFKKNKKFLKKLNGLDVVFIDGLHTYENSLRDIINSLRYLNSKGVIIVHDCYPPNAAAALPTKKFPNKKDISGIDGWTGAWCGDVWKTIYYLRKNYSDYLDICVINSDNGLGVIKLNKPLDNVNMVIDKIKFDEIDILKYSDLINNLECFLNLKPVDYVNNIILEIKKD